MYAVVAGIMSNRTHSRNQKSNILFMYVSSKEFKIFPIPYLLQSIPNLNREEYWLIFQSFHLSNRGKKSILCWLSLGFQTHFINESKPGKL